jgi:hypothetical protein
MAVELAVALECDLGQPVSVMKLLGAGSLVAIAELVVRMVGMDERGHGPMLAAPIRADTSILQEARVS